MLADLVISDLFGGGLLCRGDAFTGEIVGVSKVLGLRVNFSGSVLSQPCRGLAITAPIGELSGVSSRWRARGVWLGWRQSGVSSLFKGEGRGCLASGASSRVSSEGLRPVSLEDSGRDSSGGSCNALLIKKSPTVVRVLAGSDAVWLGVGVALVLLVSRSGRARLIG